MLISLFTKNIPIQTRIRAIIVLLLNMFSFRNIADNIEPNTGVKKLKTAILPTLLYFKSNVQRQNAIADNNPM